MKFTWPFRRKPPREPRYVGMFSRFAENRWPTIEEISPRFQNYRASDWEAASTGFFNLYGAEGTHDLPPDKGRVDVSLELFHDEVSSDALTSYYVDYYLAQVNNGGFSQFVYNSRWNSAVIQFVRDGLKKIGAKRHLALFERGAAGVQSMGKAGLDAYFNSEYFGDNARRDALNSTDDRFFELNENEDLIALNAAWLKANPKLVALDASRLTAEIARRAAAVPNRAAREAQALEKEPRYGKLIRALCAKAGHKLDRITAGDPTHVEAGKRVLAWHFLTDKGHFFMLDLDGKASMYDDDSKRIAEVVAPPDSN